MEFYDELRDTFQREYDKGCSYQDIATRYGISYYYLRALIKGERPISGITLGTFFQMFPNAYISLTGNRAHINQSASAVNNSSITQVAGDQIERDKASSALDAYQLRLFRDLSSLDIPADVKGRVLEVLSRSK